MKFLRWLWIRVSWTSFVMIVFLIIGHHLEADANARSRRALIEEGKRYILEERQAAEEERQEEIRRQRDEARWRRR